MTEYLNEKQLAKQYPISISLLQKLRLRGGGPEFIKLGSKVLYEKDRVEAWFKAQPVFKSTAQYKQA